MNMDLHGEVESGFEPVVDAFRKALEESRGHGAALSVHLDGREVVNLWGGFAAPKAGTAWAEDTPSVVFSCTKGLMSVLAAMLVAEGRLDYGRPVGDYWPEFASEGKDRITVADILAHRSGLSAPRADFAPEDIRDWEKVTSALAAQAPLWPIGQGYAYHAITHGWLIGEVLRRITGKMPGDLLAELVAGPLAADAWIGFNGPVGSVATMSVDPELVTFWQSEGTKDTADHPHWPYRAMALGHALPPGLVADGAGFNDPDMQAAQIPGAGGIATARALSRIWSATVVETSGMRLLDDTIIARASELQAGGVPVFPADGPYPRWGMGFQLDSEARRYLTPRSFGHDGAGGQCAFADPDQRIGFAFLTNWMTGAGDLRASRIISALRRAIT